MKYYLKGQHDQFEEHVVLIRSDGKPGRFFAPFDRKRLYLETLIPEFRGDVLACWRAAIKL